MVWWTFNKTEGLVKYKMPAEAKPKSEAIKDIPKELGFGEFKIIEVGILIFKIAMLSGLIVMSRRKRNPKFHSVISSGLG